MKISRRLRRRLINVGVTPEHASTWSNWVQTQIDNQGPEHAASTCKKVGDCIIYGLTGSGVKPDWVRTFGSYPKAFYGIWDYSPEIQIRVSKIARTIVLQGITPKQVAKVLPAVIDEFSGTSAGLALAWEFISKGISLLRMADNPVDLTDFPLVGRAFRRVQSVSGKTKLVSAPPILDSLTLLADMPVMRVPGWEKVFYPLHTDWIGQNIDRFASQNRTSVGEIHASQEGGGKLRMFASPYTVLQLLLTPIHNFMDFYRKQLPTDCTYDQGSGALAAQQALKEGRLVYSVDLSTATCRFPWILQETLASVLGLPKDNLDALRFVAKGHWVVGKELRTAFNRKRLKWEVGQPLGIKPSMSLFSLTHNLLLAGICLSFELDPTNTFKVLGDDVVIFDDRVHEMYIRVCDEIGVPISWHKSHSSRQYAEFAGYAVTPDLCVRAGQWRTPTKSNALSLAEQYGTPLYGEVPNLWIKVQKLWLFRLGLYQPELDEVSALIKANTLSSDVLLKDMRSTAPYWYYRIMSEYESVIQSFLGKSVLPGFHWETPSLSGLTLSKREGFDTIVDSVNTAILSTARWHGSRPSLSANAGRMILEHFRDLGIISSKEFLTLAREIYRKAHTLLYQPPGDYFANGSAAFRALEEAWAQTEQVLTT